MNYFLGHTFSFEGFIKSQDPNKKSNYNLMCIKKSFDSDSESTKSINLLIAFSVPFFIILISMFCSIIYFLRTQGLNKRIPHIIGNYRRNVLSLKETFLYTIIILVLFFLYSIVLRFHTVFEFSVDGIRLFAFTHSLVIHQLLEGVIWPIYILWNMHDKMPELFSEKQITVQKFYNLCQQKIEPRRMEEDIEGTNYKWNTQRKIPSDFTYKQNKTKIISLAKLPPAVI